MILKFEKVTRNAPRAHNINSGVEKPGGREGRMAVIKPTTGTLPRQSIAIIENNNMGSFV